MCAQIDVLGWRRRVCLSGILKDLIRDPPTTPFHYVEAYHRQVHSACRGALNVVAKAGCQEGVHGVSYCFLFFGHLNKFTMTVSMSVSVTVTVTVTVMCHGDACLFLYTTEVPVRLFPAQV
jgi:hypothetical protein